MKIELWILHMSSIILTSNLWCVYRKEWFGVVKKNKLTITSGIFVVLLYVVLVGIRNSL